MSLCWLFSWSESGCSFVFGSSFFFLSGRRGGGLLRAYSKAKAEGSPVVVPISCVIEKAITLCRVAIVPFEFPFLEMRSIHLRTPSFVIDASDRSQ